MPNKQMEWIAVTILAETDKALRVDSGVNKAWLPRSQIEDYSQESFKVGDTIEIEVGVWLLEEKGLV